ncbi:MAG: N-6 DNA methylase [Rikenellaceae bacterium]
MAYNKREHLEDNIKAIEIAFRVQKEKRSATEEEILALRKYSGFGGLKAVLLPYQTEQDLKMWSKADAPLFPLVKKLYDTIRENSSSELVFKMYSSSIKNSILSAFYTPQELVKAIADAVADSGVVVKRFLDPSAGQGVFADNFVKDGIEAVSFEKESITGSILGALHPDVNVRVEGFERIEESYNNYFDVIASNIPFGDVKVFDPAYTKSEDQTRRSAANTLHNYFFAKGLDTLRDGGVLAFITSQGVMNSQTNEPIRQMLMEQSNLISAIRLPNNLFSENAGTEVGSDLIILQKNTNKVGLSEEEQRFVEAELRPTGVTWNKYFNNLNRVVHSSWKLDTDPYGKPAIIFKHTEGNEKIAEGVKRILDFDIAKNLDKELYNKSSLSVPYVPSEPIVREDPIVELLQEQATEEEVKRPLASLFGDVAPKDEKPASKKIIEERDFDGETLPHYKKGTIVIDNDEIGFLSAINHNGAKFTPLGVNSRQDAKIRAYLPMREVYFKLFNFESKQLTEDFDSRKKLNELYDAFVQKYKELNTKLNSKVVLMDANGRDMLALERVVDQQYVKADILDHPVAFSISEEVEINNAHDALSASLNKYGEVNLDYMEELLDKPQSTVIEELGSSIFYNPLMDSYEIKDRFIAGNVIEKAERIDSYLVDNPNDERAKMSLTALQEAFPPKITFEELDFNLGERWIPDALYEEFASELFQVKVHIKYSEHLDDYSVEGSGYNAIISSAK